MFVFQEGGENWSNQQQTQPTCDMYTGPDSSPVARFSKVPETFQARKAVFSFSVSKDGEVYAPETPCMRRTSVRI